MHLKNRNNDEADGQSSNLHPNGVPKRDVTVKVGYVIGRSETVV